MGYKANKYVKVIDLALQHLNTLLKEFMKEYEESSNLAFGDLDNLRTSISSIREQLEQDLEKKLGPASIRDLKPVKDNKLLIRYALVRYLHNLEILKVDIKNEFPSLPIKLAIIEEQIDRVRIILNNL